MLRFYIRNTLRSPAMLVAVIGLYLSMVVSVWPFTSSDLLYNYQYTISLGFTPFFIPITSILPICYFQHMLTAKNAVQFCLLRSTKKSYTSAACLSAMLSGMVVMSGAFLLFTITCLLYTPVGNPHIERGLFEYTGTFYESLTGTPLLLYMVQGGIFMLNGAMWPMVSLLCFSFTSNQYLVVAVPFIVRTSMGYLMQSLELYVLDPAQLLLKGVAMQWPGGGIPYLILYSSIVAFICGGVWTFREYRRLRHG